jgi:hypothetical protein
MKHNIFKIKKLGEPQENKELDLESSNKRQTEIDTLKTSIQQTNEKMH